LLKKKSEKEYVVSDTHLIPDTRK